jgi:hypothetical protein
MAQNTRTIESVWAEKGNSNNSAIVATSDGKYPALDGSLITNLGNLLEANNLSELTATASVARTNLGLGATDAVAFGAIIPPAGTTAEIDAVTSATVGQVMIDNERKKQVRFIGVDAYEDIGGLNSSSVIEVSAGLSEVANGVLLTNAYAEAKLLTPNGATLSINNRAVLAVGCGVYSLAAELSIDTDFVDIVGLSNNTRVDAVGVKFNVRLMNSNVNVTASDVYINGIHISTSIYCGNNEPLQTFIGCIGSSNSFKTKAGGGTVAGTFIACRAGTTSFGSGETASGIFTDCLGEQGAFGGFDGSTTGTASGVFTRCTCSGSNGFASAGTASGTFIDCEATGQGGFAGANTSFASGTASGVFIRCRATGGDGFGGYDGTASGIFRNCEAVSGAGGSFAPSGTTSGKFSFCTMTTGTFPAIDGAGKMRMCLEEATMTEVNKG